ncbi:actin-like ATPase domain-containing protein [Microthyrium microscopicum]|uniref:Actin-like ATPase domain-containing protein n=1 Tax=Microthyrium microscopicum TaxID=703497 RepID=A0A6A6U0Z9_9PEZI|nr:actin-like ATPase domain-containing protein [Microthyrium microscopicum]
MANNRLTIAVDFGTTYSGVAYSNPSDESKDPILIKDWGSGPTSDKVPTVLRYNGSDKIGGVLGMKWGFEVKHHERRQEWFKLALDPMIYKAENCVDMTQSYEHDLADPPDYSRSATKMCTDYLTALRKQTQKALEKSYGASALRTRQIDWVITVPAVWSMKAKADTLKCAQEAGIGAGSKVTIVSEPEAAAAYALQTIEPMTLKEGHNFVVCDAGGGTVDLITYRLLNLSPLEVEESAISSGGKCGGTFVNRIFEKMVMQRIGEKSGLTDIGKHQMLQQFEQDAKRDFQDTGDPNEAWYLPVPGAANSSSARISGGSLIVSVADMKKCFDPVVDEVIKLVNTQISGIVGPSKEVKAVVLVGGFGGSRYLQQRLRDAIAPIELLCPANQWGAIALGAVIQSVASRVSAPVGNWSVTTRKATSSMGVEIRMPFNKALHHESRKYWCPIEAKSMCHGLMQWFVERGHNLSSKEPKVYPFYRHIRSNASLKITTATQYSLSEMAPMYSDISIRKHTALKVDLTPVKHKLTKMIGADKKEYYRINYDILATFHSAHIEYQWRYAGQVFGTVNCNYI